MRQIACLLFLLVFKTASAQLTPVKSIDTFTVKGKIVFIDSICAPAISIEGGHFQWKPYYLLLIQSESKDQWRYVVRTFAPLESLKFNKTNVFRIRRTEYERVQMDYSNSTLNLSGSVDSILKKVNKVALVSSFLEKKQACLDYNLKENIYFRYELIE